MDKEENKATIKTHVDKDIDISYVKLQKMALLYNALEDGWSIKKNKDYYIFTKNHEGKKEVYLDTYLHTFMKANFDINKIIN
tara:strand:+ start:1510 stop:1755 length:246 start_codon:yes stop_codon:yes gene_type:complete